ncbi:hypothetical protein CLF_102785 [Clonorchis sinensis]|uniref:Uncharacterized protein n=1 Tax=Clonorchis sinensis TaxID=79923 RepID=G7Y8I4_CLOSI|nr:hypothetical protein CLF_102785 [Clonorchis sinensis]
MPKCRSKQRPNRSPQNEYNFLKCIKHQVGAVLETSQTGDSTGSQNFSQVSFDCTIPDKYLSLEVAATLRTDDCTSALSMRSSVVAGLFVRKAFDNCCASVLSVH